MKKKEKMKTFNNVMAAIVTSIALLGIAVAIHEVLWNGLNKTTAVLTALAEIAVAAIITWMTIRTRNLLL